MEINVTGLYMLTRTNQEQTDQITEFIFTNIFLYYRVPSFVWLFYYLSQVTHLDFLDL